MASAYKTPYFLSRDGDKLIFNEKDKEFIFYVPEKYFDTNNAVIVGDIVQVFGLLDYQIVDSKGKVYVKKNFSYPTTINTKPRSIEKVKGLKLTKYSEPTDYRLFKYSKGDVIILSVKTEQNISYVEDLWGLLLRGNLPNTISYDQLQNIIWKNMEINGNKYAISMQDAGIVISELYRKHDDLSKPFRESKGNDMFAYKAIPCTMVPKKVSPYASITSENWDEGVVGAIMIKDGKYSPVEKVLTD